MRFSAPAGYASSWARDGLVLIGDSAHARGPIGAQGINLAIQDAVLLHPVLVNALRRHDTSTAAVAGYIADRRGDIDVVMQLQTRQGKAMLSDGGPVAARVHPIIARLLAYTPLYRKILWQIAFGRREIRLASELFT